MITKELINSTLTADNSSETSLNLGKMSAMVNWDINGGTGASTRNIYLYGRIKSNNNVVARGNTGFIDTTFTNLLSDPNKIADFTSTWNAAGGITGSIDTHADPDGGTTGDTLIALAANGTTQNSTQDANVGSVVNNKVTFSVYVKQIAADTNKELSILMYLINGPTVEERLQINVGLDVVNIKSIQGGITNGPTPYNINDVEIYDTGVSDWYKISFCMTDYKGNAPIARIRYYPKINGGNLTDTSSVVWGGSIVTGDSTAVFDPTEWVLIDSVENQARLSSGSFTLENIYPQVAVRTSGNAGESTIRVWATYNELVN